MRLRPYQQDAVNAIFAEWQRAKSTLLSLPTGCGKTIVFGTIVDQITATGRCMVLAHREELIYQAVDKIEAITGVRPDIEMAELRANRTLYGRSAVVVSSIQTQVAGRNGDGRMTSFDPNDFSLLVVDEAHHATAPTYRRVIDHYRQNPNLKVLGVTATPDRADEEALGQIFDTVAFDYELPDAIHDGWLVPIRQRSVVVAGLDYSTIRTTAGDLNGADLAAVLEFEDILHGIASPTLELTAGRKTLVFAASVAHAERLCEIFNRHQADCARWVCGETAKPERRQIIAQYAAGHFPILVNVGVATEGFDDPSIAVVVMARPTKSRALYAQMAGRGTRPLPGLVDGPVTPEERRAIILNSSKPNLEIIDFVGNSGRHKLITTADILGGRYSDATVARAKAMAEEAAGEPVDMDAALRQAERLLEEEKERARRAAIRLNAQYSSRIVNPFDILDLEPHVERGWNKDRQPTPKMLAFLEKAGVPTRGVSFIQAGQLIERIIARRQSGECTYKQAKTLARYGYSSKLSFADANALLDRLARNNWKPLPVTEGEPAYAG